MEAKSGSGSPEETPINVRKRKNGGVKNSRPKKRSGAADSVALVDFMYNAHIAALQALSDPSQSSPNPFADPSFKLIAYTFFKQRYVPIASLLYYPEHLLHHLELLLAYAHYVKVKQLYGYFERIYQQYNGFTKDTDRLLKTNDLKIICCDSKAQLTDGQRSVIENILQEEKKNLLEYSCSGSSPHFFNVLVNLSVILGAQTPSNNDIRELKQEIIQQSEIKYMHAFMMIDVFFQTTEKNSPFLSLKLNHLMISLNQLLGFQVDNSYLTPNQKGLNAISDEKKINPLTLYTKVSESNSSKKVYLPDPGLYEGMACCTGDFEDQKGRIQLIKGLIEKGGFKAQDIPFPQFIYKLHQAATSGDLSLAFEILKNERSDFMSIVKITHTVSYVKLLVGCAAMLSVGDDRGNSTCYLGDQDCWINSKVILSFFSTLYAAYHSGSDPSIKSLITLEGGYMRDVMIEVMRLLFQCGNGNGAFLMTPPSHHMSPGRPNGFCVMSPAAIVLCMRIRENINIACLGTDINADNGLRYFMPYLLSLSSTRSTVSHLDLHSRLVFPEPTQQAGNFSCDGYAYQPVHVESKSNEEVHKQINFFLSSLGKPTGFVLHLLGLDSSNRERSFGQPGPFTSRDYVQIQCLIDSYFGKGGQIPNPSSLSHS